MPKSAARDYYTTKEIAAMMAVSITTVAEMIKRGRFPGAYKIDPALRNSPYRVPKTSYEKFLQEQRGKATK
jgi:excisionase family DNA binding protein